MVRPRQAAKPRSQTAESTTNVHTDGWLFAQLLAPFGWNRVGNPPVRVDRRGDQRRRLLSRQERLEPRRKADLDHARRVLAEHVQDRSLHVEEGQSEQRGKTP